MNKKVLVTGAGGYIGRHVVTALLDKGAEVVAVDLRLDGVDQRAQKSCLNIFEDSPTLYKDLGSPDICLHLAWRDGFKHNSDEHLNNLSAHFSFLRNMVEQGAKNIAVMGTMHEIGYWEGVITEDTPCAPLSLYGIAKNALRQALFTYLKDKDVVFQWLRAFYIFGDDTRNNSIFAKILQAADEGKKEFPFTSGINKYDFICVTELANQITAAVLQDKVSGIINCCSGKPVMLKDKVMEFIKEHDLDMTLKFNAFPDRAYDSPAVWGDKTKIEAILALYENCSNQ